MNSWMNKKRKIRFLYMEYIEKLHSQHKSISFIELKEKEKMFLLLTKLKYEYIGIVFIFHKTFGEICKIIFLSTGERKKNFLFIYQDRAKRYTMNGKIWKEAFSCSQLNAKSEKMTCVCVYQHFPQFHACSQKLPIKYILTNGNNKCFQ